MGRPLTGGERRSKKRRVLAALAKGATIAEAARAARVGEDTVGRWRREDPDFRAAGDAVREAATDRMEGVLEVAAAKARTDPRFQTSLIFYLKNRRPERWRDVQHVQHGGELMIRFPDLAEPGQTAAAATLGAAREARAKH